MRIRIKSIPGVHDGGLEEWAREAMIGLELAISEVSGAWSRFGDTQTKGSYYTVSYKGLYLALKMKDKEAAKALAFCISSDIKFVLLEKIFCEVVSE